MCWSLAIQSKTRSVDNWLFERKHDPWLLTNNNTNVRCVPKRISHPNSWNIRVIDFCCQGRELILAWLFIFYFVCCKKGCHPDTSFATPSPVRNSMPSLCCSSDVQQRPKPAPSSGRGFTLGMLALGDGSMTSRSWPTDNSPSPSLPNSHPRHTHILRPAHDTSTTRNETDQRCCCCCCCCRWWCCRGWKAGVAAVWITVPVVAVVVVVEALRFCRCRRLLTRSCRRPGFSGGRSVGRADGQAASHPLSPILLSTPHTLILLHFRCPSFANLFEWLAHGRPSLTAASACGCLVRRSLLFSSCSHWSEHHVWTSWLLSLFCLRFILCSLWKLNTEVYSIALTDALWWSAWEITAGRKTERILRPGLCLLLVILTTDTPTHLTQTGWCRHAGELTIRLCR